MELRHLDDRAIQDYLDGTGTPEAEQHLDFCAECRARVEEYKLVYQALEDDSEFRLPYNFAEAVMSRVGAETVSPEPRRIWEPVLYIIGAAALVWGVLYYFGAFPKSLPDFSYGYGYIKALMNFDLVNYMANLFKSADLNPMIIVMTVIVLCFYGAVDYLYRHRKTKPTTLCV